MTAGSISSGFGPNWFTLSGSGPVRWASLKSEGVSRFREAVKAEEQERKATLGQYAAEVRERGRPSA